jgi:hypothetical protein
MGGLAARWYLENRALWPVDCITGKSVSCIHKLITLGTPHLGTDIMLADPLATITVARSTLLGRESSLNVDTVTDWSDGLNEMYAQWMPPPPNNEAPPSGYPLGWVVDKWPTNAGGTSYASPILDGSIVLAKGVLDLFQVPSKSASNAIEEAVRQFDLDPTERFAAHRAYVNSYVNPLGLSVWARNPKRYISSFLYRLNETLKDMSGAQEYAVAGDDSSFFLLLNGPYHIPSDGVVPEESALGVDPLTHLSLIPNIASSGGGSLPYAYNHVIVPTNHTALPGDAGVIGQVLTWLLAYE